MVWKVAMSVLVASEARMDLAIFAIGGWGMAAGVSVRFMGLEAVRFYLSSYVT